MNIENYIGQKHLLGENGPIYKMIKNKYIESIILYGNPGIGKTTLAKIIAKELNLTQFTINGATTSLNEIKEIVNSNQLFDKFIIIIDEIHRLDKQKQNYLLPYLEKEQVFIIGTTTENPYITVNAALRSRLLLFQLHPIKEYEYLEHYASLYDYNIDILKYLFSLTNSDIRMTNNILTFLNKNYNNITLSEIKEIFKNNISFSDDKSYHYDLISALQKSIRASDVNASVHYLAKLLDFGDYDALLRRLVVIAYEDIGLGNPNACSRCVAATQAFREIGMPEGRIILANTVVELALSPKSTTTYTAISLALADLNNTQEIPNHLVYNQPHKELYTPQTCYYQNNLPKQLKNQSYFISQESSEYERALNKNHQKRINDLKGYNGKI